MACLVLLILASHLAACGNEPTATVRPTQAQLNPPVSPSTAVTEAEVTKAVTGQQFSPPARTTPDSSTAAPPGSKTAVPFFSPTVIAATTQGEFRLAWDDSAGATLLEAGVVAPPPGAADDWQALISAEGVARFTRQPRNQGQATTVEYFMNRDRLNKLLEELDKLGVLSWPETTPGSGPARNLALNLKGRAKRISDLSGKDDNLSRMLQLVRDSIEAAPPRNAP